MPESSDGSDFQRRMERIEELLHEVEQAQDGAAQTREIVQAVLELHGAGLERMLEHIAADGDRGLALIDTLSQDDLIGSLFVLHGLHPLDLETRIRQALDQTRPYLRSHGGNVELLSVVGGIVRLRMEGSCHGCPSSSLTLKLAIEKAIYDKAPDVTAIELANDNSDSGQVERIPERFALPVLR